MIRDDHLHFRAVMLLFMGTHERAASIQASTSLTAEMKLVAFRKTFSDSGLAKAEKKCFLPTIADACRM